MAWAVLPLFMPRTGRGGVVDSSRYLNAGHFMLPLFGAAKPLPEAIATGFAERAVSDAVGAKELQRAIQEKQITPLDGASVTLCVDDLQLPVQQRPDLRPTDEQVDLSQLGACPGKKAAYTTPLAAAKLKSTFASSLCAKKEAPADCEARVGQMLANAVV